MLMFLSCQGLEVISVFIISHLFVQLSGFFFAFWSLKHEGLTLNYLTLKNTYTHKCLQ